MTKNRIVFLIVAVITVVMMGMQTAPVAAQGKVAAKNLELSDSETGVPRATFPLDTTTVFVRFDYENTDRTSIAVVLEGLGLTDIYYHSDRYDGDGNAVVPITGSDVFESLVFQLGDAAEAAQTAAKRARDGNQGHQGYMLQVQQHAFHMNAILDIFDSLPLDAALMSSVADARDNVAELARLAEDAVGLDPEDVQALAVEMKGPADTVVQVADDISEQAGNAGELPLPPTGTGRGEYTVQLLLGFGTSGGSPAEDTSFTIVETSQAGAAADLPSDAPAPTKTSVSGSGGAQPTRTTAPSSSRTGSGGNPTARPGATSASGDTDSGSGSSGETGSSGQGDAETDSGIGSDSRSVTTTRATPVSPGDESGSGQSSDGSDDGAGEDSSGDESEAQQLGAVGDQSSDGGVAESAQGDAMPTWTAPAVVAYDSSGQLQTQSETQPVDQLESGSSGSSNRNLVLLVVGVVALVGVAVWLRGRM